MGLGRPLFGRLSSVTLQSDDPHHYGREAEYGQGHGIVERVDLERPLQRMNTTLNATVSDGHPACIRRAVPILEEVEERLSLLNYQVRTLFPPLPIRRPTWRFQLRVSHAASSGAQHRATRL
ncbi:MAG: hypothetical protein M3378_05015 [Actinomycetota bacterium]|nr:hypothetical protein [Actinomycetota bacterium]